MIYKSSVDFPTETEAIDESCFDFTGDFIGDVSNDFFNTCILKEVGLRVENGLAGFAADRRAPYAQSVTV